MSHPRIHTTAAVATLALLAGGIAIHRRSHRNPQPQALAAPIPVQLVADRFADIPRQRAAASRSSNIARPRVWHRIGRWSAAQVSNAAVIVAVGQQRRVPRRGWVIAVAVSMTESNLNNYGRLRRNDHDSQGLFQQRPSQGWGSPAQVRDPRHAAAAFYGALRAVSGWQGLPLGQAAQAVQRSAFPGRYAQFAGEATRVVSVVES